MNRRFLAGLVGAGATAAAAWLYLSQPRPAPPAPAVVPIADGKTIDFSSGRATVRSTAADQATLDAAVKEMDAATKDISFQSNPPKK